jgi:hypothetical protein
VDDFAYAREFENGRIVNVALVAEDADGGPLAAGDGDRLQLHRFDGAMHGVDLHVRGTVVHNDQHKDDVSLPVPSIRGRIVLSGKGDRLNRVSGKFNPFPSSAAEPDAAAMPAAA